MITISIKRELDAQFVSDVLVTAFDGSVGGCWYWADVPHDAWLYVEKSPVDMIEDLWTRVIIKEQEPDEESRGQEYTVDAKTIEGGIQAILDGSVEISIDLMAMLMTGVLHDDTGEIDAEVADCIVQAGLFGEVRYG